MKTVLYLAALVGLLGSGFPHVDSVHTESEETVSPHHHPRVMKDTTDDSFTGDFWVRHVGDRRAIIRDGNLGPTIALDSLSEIPHLYAIGPISGLRGEITIYDSDVSIATIRGDAPHVTSTMDEKAIFLVWASADEWTTVRIPRSLTGLGELEAFVRTAARENGLSLTQPFPFRVEGRVSSLTYHIIFKTRQEPHDRAEHRRAKRRFSESDAPVRMVGFWADEAGEGVYTHMGMRTHVHFEREDRTTSGHVDDLVIQPGATLYLPK